MASTVPTFPTARGAEIMDAGLRARIEHARATVTGVLLRERDSRGVWTGELSSSALSTATAVVALTIHARGGSDAREDRFGKLVGAGTAWLVRHQNADGGWGDTIESISNLSTTTLVWAALGLAAERDPETARALESAERWLTRAAGSLEPARLVRAIEDSYGADRTFSIPILTMCALCGRLGAGASAWHHVRQLPFEIAALPQRWFAALKLPVVSYALPALIAIGQVRHALRPTRNLPMRWLRDRCRQRTLDKLVRLQPENGGFLEAAPLTSFVVMSLAATGLNEHVVVRRGVAFLQGSVRPDGSWPIDTNLATWLTTLAVNALAPAQDASGDAALDPGTKERASIRDWLLKQQFRREHPYTLAAPGGWAWTDLPGGVPDADDTAGALLALHRLGPAESDSGAAAVAGITWLLDLQNSDGGIPTFCRGWGTLPFDRSSPDLTAHAIRAWLAWHPHLPTAVRMRVDRALTRAAEFLRGHQAVDGAWSPLWFGHQQHPAGENPVYGTARVIPALCELDAARIEGCSASLERALKWLVARQNVDGGWCGAPASASSVEETAVALEAAAAACGQDGLNDELRQALQRSVSRGAGWLVSAVERDRWRTPSAIGLYFAKLWYHERLYPILFAAGALNRLAALR